VVNASVLLLGLWRGWGVLSYAAGAWSGFVVQQVCIATLLRRTGFVPRLGGAVFSWRLLKPLAAFAGNVFFISLGTQMIAMAPTVLISRGQLGLQALSDWTVGTRLFGLGQQLVQRVPVASEAAFWEMQVRQEFDRLRERFGTVARMGAVVASFIGGGLVAVNRTFVELWSKGQVSWTLELDCLCAFWLLAVTLSVTWNMVPGIVKRLGAMKYFYFGEGCLVMTPGWLAVRLPHLQWIPGILIFSICACRIVHGATRVCNDLGVSARDLSRWTLIALLSLAINIAFGWCVSVALAGIHNIPRLILSAAFYCAVAAPVSYWIGIPEEAKVRIRAVWTRVKFRRRDVI
jgi:O-antigen/teichoic acid export membrane protein